MASVEKVPMLAEGYEKMSSQLSALKAERPLIVDAIEEARAHGDLSENAEYHAAKERQGQVEATIGDLEDKLSRAQVIDPTTLSGDRIVFGATVTLADEDDKPVKYQIVGQAEADANLAERKARAVKWQKQLTDARSGIQVLKQEMLQDPVTGFNPPASAQ